MSRRESMLQGSLCALLALLAGCGPQYVNRNDRRDPPVQAPPLFWTEPTYGWPLSDLGMDLVASPTHLRPGERLTMELHLTNLGPTVLEYWAPHPSFGFRVEDVNGEVVASGSSGSTWYRFGIPPGAFLRLAPGQTEIVTLTWDYVPFHATPGPSGSFFLFAGFGREGRRGAAPPVTLILSP